ncbi:hypothetical protein VNO78_35284 [Psophocarpus tetragonolobus]|uniref:Uncharacterized protein n=1 Tax=Psophocarpus tetragonolobus TaxID=3891 RepID=A0AAN9NUC0_PSOTE
MPKSVVSTFWKLARRCLPLGLIGPNAQISLTKNPPTRVSTRGSYSLKGSICNLSRSTQATGIKGVFAPEAKSFRQDAQKVIDRDMLNTCFLKKGWLLAFFFGHFSSILEPAFSKCSSSSLCSDRKSHFNGLVDLSFVQS